METPDDTLTRIVHAITSYAEEAKTRLGLERGLRKLMKQLHANEIDLVTFVDYGGGQIHEQLKKAVFEAARKLGIDPGIRAAGLRGFDLSWVAEMANEQYPYLVNIGNQIIAAREKGLPVDPFLARIPMWGQLYERAYNKALVELASGNEVYTWEMGETVEHCATCLALSGQIATAYHWKLSGFIPQGRMLECQGYKCLCRFVIISKAAIKKLIENGWVSKVPTA